MRDNTVDADRTRNHVQMLLLHGITQRVIAKRAGVSRETVGNVLGYQPTVSRETEQRLLAVRAPEPGDWSWSDDAECATPHAAQVAQSLGVKVVDLFYTRTEDLDAGKRQTRQRTLQRIAAARALCDACPVQNECLDHAITKPETSGVWGGLTAQEIGRLRRKKGNK